MKRQVLEHWRKGLLWLILGAAIGMSARYDLPGSVLPESARRFVQYYQCLGSGEWRVPYWERIMLSLVLAHNQDQIERRTALAR